MTLASPIRRDGVPPARWHDLLAIRVTKKARRDFDFLRRTELNLVGTEHGQVTGDPTGATALQCWYAKDAMGKKLPCREPELLEKLMRAKASWNLQVKMWAEAMADPLMLMPAELAEYCRDLPPWIYRATMRQAQKLLLEKNGFIPSWARLA